MSDFKSAIPTEYRGVMLKSRMEAQCAFLFDQLGWDWKYESESLMLSNGTTYIPDFVLKDGALVVECRGYENKRGDRQIAGFIRDLPSRSIQMDETCRYLVMGPTECTVYESDGTETKDYPARVTFCHRCDQWDDGWQLHSFARQWKELCPSCVELTFNDYPLTVEKGKFFIGPRPIDDAAGVFNRDSQRGGWFCNFIEHIQESLNRRHLNPKDEEDLAQIILRIMRPEGV